MIRLLTLIALFLCSGCFNNSREDTERLGCGVVDPFPTKEVETPYIFKARCATCHHFYKNGTGPKMEGILDRVPSKDWLRRFITNQDSLIQVEDECTLEIMNWSPVKWNHNRSNLSRQDLDSLLNFITQ